jgi:hypothetical protein
VDIRYIIYVPTGRRYIATFTRLIRIFVIEYIYVVFSLVEIPALASPHGQDSDIDDITPIYYFGVASMRADRLWLQQQPAS